jgi:hypothetical protein
MEYYSIILWHFIFLYKILCVHLLNKNTHYKLKNKKMSYKTAFYEKRKEEIITSYKKLRKEKNTRQEALEILSPIFSLTPESLKIVMSRSNYNRENKKPIKNT